MTLGVLRPIDAPPAFLDAYGDELVDRPAWMTRTEPCACGGMIVAPDMPGMIAAAVDVHNASTLHCLWRRAAGIR